MIKVKVNYSYAPNGFKSGPIDILKYKSDDFSEVLPDIVEAIGDNWEEVEDEYPNRSVEDFINVWNDVEGDFNYPIVYWVEINGKRYSTIWDEKENNKTESEKLIEITEKELAKCGIKLVENEENKNEEILKRYIYLTDKIYDLGEYIRENKDLLGSYYTQLHSFIKSIESGSRILEYDLKRLLIK